MSKIAFMFSGQGAQHVGMGKELYDNYNEVKALFDDAEKQRPGTLAQCFEGDEATLKMTENTQPCLYLADLAAAVALKSEGIEPNACAGFSLGEIPSLALCGAYSYMQGFELATKRGSAMAKASKENPASMLAVVKLDNKTVEDICDKYEHIYPVNYNCSGQLVVSGKPEYFEEFSAEIKNAGGRALPLKVSGGFHSPFMNSASAEFGEVLESAEINAPKITAYSNYTAKPYGDDVKSLLKEQINHPVHWEMIIKDLLENGYDTFIEVGVGNVLMKLCQKITAGVDGVKIYKCENKEDIEKIKSEL